ncbi:MAG: DNA cytosine methyltransferase [Dehalococcoidia bacterium]|nr:DNA cytosine methyltransferase [Dehalococcoidia bacterium]
MDIPPLRPSFLAIDFYCGAGGTTRGLLDAGGYVIAGIDKDPDCEDTYRKNNTNQTLDGVQPAYLAFDLFLQTDDYPEGQQDEAFEAVGNLIAKYREMSPDTPLLFAICAPCQSFTKFVQHHLTDARATSRTRDENLLAQTIRFIREFSPDMIMSENVAGIRRGKYAGLWAGFQDELHGMDYVLGDSDVCASRFGVPQKRKRSILLAVKAGDATSDLIVPDQDEETVEVSAREALGTFPRLEAGQFDESVPNHQCRGLAPINRERLMSLRPGQPNFDLPIDLQLPCHRRLEEKGKRGFGDVYTRLAPDRPAPTITTRFHSVSNGRFGHYDMAQPRGLSLREGASLQSFPEDYEFHGRSMDAIAKMIGNAVPPKLSRFMAEYLLRIHSQGAPS